MASDPREVRPDKPEARRRPKQAWLPLAVLAAAILFHAGRLLWIVDRYSVNLLYWDQWDFHTPLFDRLPLWQHFTWQHGPHRQGLGLLLSGAVAGMSGWNTRAEAFLIWGLLFLAAVAALWLKRRRFGALTGWDAAIPCAILAPANWEHFVVAPNNAHSVLPLLLILLYCLAWTIPGPGPRYVAVVGLNFLLIFTGFGVFIGLISPVLLLSEVYRAHRAEDPRRSALALLALGMAVLSMGAFFIGYRNDPAVDCFEFPYHKPVDYLWFASLMFSRFFCLVGLKSYPLGVTLLLGCAAVALYHGRRLVQAEEAGHGIHAVVFTLAAFSLIFVASTAVGRVCTGLGSAAASRYVTLVAPGILGIYLHLVSIRPCPPGRAYRVLAVLFPLAVIGGTAPVPPSQSRAMEYYRAGKTAWVRHYLATADLGSATTQSGFQVYPLTEETDLSRKLRYLQARRLNLFLPRQ